MKHHFLFAVSTLFLVGTPALALEQYAPAPKKVPAAPSAAPVAVQMLTPAPVTTVPLGPAPASPGKTPMPAKKAPATVLVRPLPASTSTPPAIKLPGPAIKPPAAISPTQPAAPAPGTVAPTSATAPALRGGGFGATSTGAPPHVINTPAARQLTPPALTRQLNLRNESFTSLKREVERRRAATEAEASRRLAERRDNGNYGQDCDDSRADVHIGATEVCDLVDNDCDGLVDEGATLPRYLDADGDGHGSPANRVNICPSEISANAAQAEAGTAPWLVELGNDCDDSNPARWYGCR